ncbi:hypothetical protein A3H10_00785 [Candidatus Uhrbacteria bacterium RIFCSPLOWO2_12_FULL_46_10]|uniref:Addiction module toxin, HicA family n=1 Tax=Candidatus Uhrbacteria bacterium RIFCSPLOWO2_01_FULL_47_25 TaxID=1802402 RepID=A0A1F7URR2_9BACT|nr:MAG: hypothetical protein A2752_02275 [Candidatus Uhrbacteria bacterium RIFCSPHIGHO2_01_FULL_46_23]OGL68131.1 MAG: hypothetical protein A3D60_03960 [Candidatus Uhrbacteria bacterium RIFCSPHIGHO2_02_FULL_47_29]OGL74825.1 MAG: hypothetical protein A3E96_04730 [Candidatus Uhrbacteria bacterium RIFCSPHIGHO2_12_FULL_46_13]OGL80982.1 MAG: hypothetical protein A2936_03295 [Candidatus Uhrbacteria bacterium RIFCSPLOWO2_01_FULL_47_25]OGL84697.1 MAG: hypothetical protein A3I37_05015 [Candidatus Uhrbact
MPKLPAVKPRDFIRVVIKLGFFRHHKSQGSHIAMTHPDGRRVVVAMHAGRDIPKGTLYAMIKDLNISTSEFIDLL